MMEDCPNNCPIIDPSRTKSCRCACWTRGLTMEHEADDRGVNLKICAAFSGVKSFPFKKMIFQFWRPRAEGGRLVLECYRNPHAVSLFDRLLGGQYRSLCTKYRYSIDDPNSNPNPPWIISAGGPVATAFLNRYPEVVLDLSVHRGSPLVDCGLDCDLACGVMLPVFDDKSSCVGVIECSMKNPAFLLPVFNELRRGLERQGLTIYHFQASWPYRANIPGDFEAAKTEIEKGLEIACESHDLTLGQVWISYTQREHIRLVKLSRYFVDFDDNPLKHFYDKFDVISGEGLAWKTLATHQPHLCRNIYKLSDNSGVLALISANTRSSCFVICLRSTHTGELDYVFEFFWPCCHNHSVLSETLLLTLRKYLPSFKFASGEQLGDEFTFIDVENPSSNLEDQEDDLAILAAYRNEGSLFYLPRSSTFEDLMLKLHKEFELDPARTHTVEYEVSPGKWSSLVCLESCRRTEDMGVVKLRVRPDGIEVGWLWRDNC
ncbi:hypothetical protein SSX86_030253 [Deinandra increscens subsp. villosa]|uniref:NLP1-9 GAF domain-containing protein n=1 Tax=Deinandra increscens subsp. villosa TaxID=3103831 RepID=A0AAP0CB23_9ASTR